MYDCNGNYYSKKSGKGVLARWPAHGHGCSFLRHLLYQNFRATPGFESLLKYVLFAEILCFSPIRKLNFLAIQSRPHLLLLLYFLADRQDHRFLLLLLREVGLLYGPNHFRVHVLLQPSQAYRVLDLFFPSEEVDQSGKVPNEQ